MMTGLKLLGESGLNFFLMARICSRARNAEETGNIQASFLMGGPAEAADPSGSGSDFDTPTSVADVLTPREIISTQTET